MPCLVRQILPAEGWACCFVVMAEERGKVITLISDIHGNLEALQAVFADIDARGTGDTIYCLGDIVGYGPNPAECVDLVRERCVLHLKGNHDHALLNGPVGFNVLASQAIDYHRSVMEPVEGDPEVKWQRWNYVKSLETTREEDGMLFVHASPRDPLNEYILPTDPEYDPDKVGDIFAEIEHLCFVGHTHLPGVLTEEPAFLTPEQLDMSYTFGEGKAVINIGSVGQPRDTNPAACYLELDDDGVRWRRVEYDFNETIRKIKAIAEIDDRLGDRLSFGR